MKIKMKSTRYGSADGVRVDEYKKDETYDVRESLAAIFLKEGWAVKVDKAPRRTKDRGGAPENKFAPSKRRRA
jgi:hypothetical protein